MPPRHDPNWDGTERRRSSDMTHYVVTDGNSLEKMLGHLTDAVVDLRASIQEQKDTAPAAVATGVASVLANDTVMSRAAKAAFNAAASDEDGVRLILQTGRKVMADDASRASGRLLWRIIRSGLLDLAPRLLTVVLVAAVLGLEPARRLVGFIFGVPWTK